MRNILAKAFVALMIVTMMAVPAIADTWTINFTTQGDADHIVLYHGTVTGAMTAEQFINRSDLEEITLPITSPQNFVIDYDNGVNYAIYGRVFDAAGDSVPFMHEDNGILYPIVWQATAIPEIGSAQYDYVVPSVDGTNVINITINQGR